MRTSIGDGVKINANKQLHFFGAFMGFSMQPATFGSAKVVVNQMLLQGAPVTLQEWSGQVAGGEGKLVDTWEFWVQ